VTAALNSFSYFAHTREATTLLRSGDFAFLSNRRSGRFIKLKGRWLNMTLCERSLISCIFYIFLVYSNNLGHSGARRRESFYQKRGRAEHFFIYHPPFGSKSGRKI